MKLKNISKFIIVFVCALLINSSNFNNSYADDHTPQRKIINELKKEIIDLGAKPVKKKHIFYEVPISYYGRSYQEGKKIKLKDAFLALYCLFKYRFF